MIFSALHRAGVLGINRRDAELISRENPREHLLDADDKVRTKALCQAHGVAAPELLGVLRSVGELAALPERLAPHSELVIKPARGAGGSGVLVLCGREGAAFRKADGPLLSIRDLRYAVSSILSGLHSLGAYPDAALIERRVRPHPALELGSTGTPDIRVLSYRSVPAMAMLRLPTRASGGRANLHQGAVAVGLDLETGRAVRASLRDRPIVAHPDTGASLLEISVPHWSDLLLLATQASAMTPLGYLGVDVVLDPERGPLLLELNARPGLSIQVATGRGLLPALEAIASAAPERLDIAGRVALARRIWRALDPKPSPSELELSPL